MKLAQTGTLYDVGLRELGENLILQTFRDAATVLMRMETSARHAHFIQQSVICIQGSGLEAIAQTFGSALDLEHLRESFQWKLRHVVADSSHGLNGHRDRR